MSSPGPATRAALVFLAAAAAAAPACAAMAFDAGSPVAGLPAWLCWLAAVVLITLAGLLAAQTLRRRRSLRRERLASRLIDHSLTLRKAAEDKLDLAADFFDQARSSGWFDIVYEDTECTIMYIRDQKLEPDLNDAF